MEYFDESVRCLTCRKQFIVEYATAVPDEGSTSITPECPYCSVAVRVELERPATLFVALAAGQPLVLRTRP